LDSEQLLLSALAACFTTTFEAVARSAKFPYTDLEVEVDVPFEKTGWSAPSAKL